jgi:hypothetical protein
MRLRSFSTANIDHRRKNDSARGHFARNGLTHVLGGTLLLS